eukprot:CAMPEP_0167799544 /NCGR_PEP_ID=MMETSP0111_2-20121227/17098_1 /TAXON_ID=91324 /ORGANISM="Lotharella globosa, Strain CCCM811" /LENGTH=109 /DNA_ID=CAMNT_0007694431 /DNA_START=169 /DNA_END=499 /DNA_ORIENTATION=-
MLRMLSEAAAGPSRLRGCSGNPLLDDLRYRPVHPQRRRYSDRDSRVIIARGCDYFWDVDLHVSAVGEEIWRHNYTAAPLPIQAATASAMVGVAISMCATSIISRLETLL